MGKSSSSRTKKRSKVSSEARTRKKSKSKTKTRKYRSKKLRCRDDSSSYSGEDDSRSLESLSSFSSDDDLRSRRARSRARKDAKGSKKRARRRSYSPDSSEDSPRRKKRKLAKKKNDKKTHLRKKPSSNASVSSRSSASFRCSTCPSESISSDEIESKRHRGRPGKRNRDDSGINKVESGTKKARYRSRSCSLRSQRSESGDCRSEEKVTYENNTRRLRSVVTVAEENEHGRWMDTDAHKEEITYDDDYPSCRSNDSNDGGGKRELDDRLDVAFEKRMEVESGKEEEAYVSNVLIMDLKDSRNILEKDCTGQDDGIGITDSVNENKNEVSGAISSLPGEDLESILRQRALENLKRFKESIKEFQRIRALLGLPKLCPKAAIETAKVSNMSSDKQQDEATDGSQFEQKTMSVMRGSEMVQVSYKVYIPKKAPALARRQLKR
ncbi:uncharacterized protein DDB_G0287625 [Pyrus x bretschneideri]|uniref:uncharacterized protein DDB_G0287625 n=1 Tax=Pyrus x bretschneideri TaxID=225117 RepID=UPI00202EC70F|nr:uncharacterized protein DDB_G0287625 [Pyrus x bretschneideri]